MSKKDLLNTIRALFMVCEIDEFTICKALEKNSEMIDEVVKHRTGEAEWRIAIDGIVVLIESEPEIDLFSISICNELSG